MKKNKMMRLASVMLVATLMTTSVISGTFAKYTTQDSGSDVARVAKWGVTVTANGQAFATSYAKDDETATITKASVNNGGADSMNLVAPGTKGEMAKMTLSGTPEVAVEVTYDANLELSNNWVGEDGTYYCPLVITITTKDNQDQAVEAKYYGTNYNDVDTFEANVEAAINAYSKQYEANTDLAKQDDDTLAISWEWPFETLASDNKTYRDNDDTALGNQASLGNYATVTLEVTTTVTQID